ncbi:MAG TPA: ABC transporter permease [Nitrospirota bacterium]|nr:ABC transporter permease [Nitrospirota bacterium]
MRNFFGHVGRMFIVFLQDLSSMYFLLGETLTQTAVVLVDRNKRKQARLLEHVDEIGTHSLLLVLTVAALLGIALTILVSFELKEIDALSYIPGFVAVAVFREIGPLITGMIVAGRVGAAFTARIGTMKVSEEILALETMAISPVRFLVVQRFIGLLLALPALTMLANFTSVLGGFLFGSSRLGIRPDTYVRETLDVLLFKDMYSGLAKAAVFSVVIVMVGCYRGLTVEGGAEDVGRSTMVSVVSSMLAIIVLDTIMTAAFYG